MTSREIELRKVGIGQAELVADLLTECRPASPVDPVVLGHRWATMQLAWFQDRSLVYAGAEPAGFATAFHAPWEREPERIGRWSLSLLPAATELAPAVVARLEALLRERGARILSAGAYEDQGWLVSALVGLGYRFDTLERHWELDLGALAGQVPALVDRERRRMARARFRLATLDTVEGEPWIWDRLTAMIAQVEQDIPHTVPIHQMALDEVRAELAGPETGTDRVWLALRGREIAGISYLTFPPRRGPVTTALTGTARAYRRRGVARAVKTISLAQAAGLGVTRVHTVNDERNTAMLRINAALGYQPLVGWARYLKVL